MTIDTQNNSQNSFEERGENTTREQQENNKLDQKDVAFYQAAVSAWITTNFEYDKHLLNLSGVAIGLLVTLMSTIGVASVQWLLIYIATLGCFFVCILTILWIFKRNAKHLLNVIKENHHPDEVLGILDKVAISSFLLGLILTSLIGVFSAIHLLNRVPQI